jgi:hypothetical protein
MTASRPSPFSIYEQTIRFGPAKHHVYMPSTHCGKPNSAFMGAMPRVTPASTSWRYKFHQPLRSETKYSDAPSGDHSGWKIASDGPPAIGAPSTNSVVPSHGMLG